MKKSTNNPKGRPSRIRVEVMDNGSRRFFTCPRKGEPEEITAAVSVIAWQPELASVSWNGREYSGGREVWDGCEGKERAAFLSPVKVVASMERNLNAEQAVEIMRSGSEDWLRRYVASLSTSGKHGARNVFRAYAEAVERGEVKPGGCGGEMVGGVKAGITLSRWLNEKCPLPSLYGSPDEAPVNMERINPIAERNRPVLTDCDGKEWNAWEKETWLLPDAPGWIPRIPARGISYVTCPVWAAEQLGIYDKETSDLCQQKVWDWIFHGCPQSWEPYGIPAEFEELLESAAVNPPWKRGEE